MTTTSVFNNLENTDNFEKIYVITNKSHGYRTVLPFPEEKFLVFLEELFKDLEIDDYEISYKTLSEQINKQNIINSLYDIFKTKCLTFSIDNKIKTSTDFFNNLDEILVNHMKNSKLLQIFKLLNVDKDEKSTSANTNIKQNVQIDIRDQTNKCTRIVEIVKENKLDNNDTVVPYNHYEYQAQDNDEIIPAPDTSQLMNESMPVSYYSWKAEEYNQNKANFYKCAILYCHSQYTGFVVEKDNTAHIVYLTNNFKDFELIKIYEKLTQKEVDDIRTYFHKRDFESKELINNKITSFETLFDINSEKPVDSTSFEIECFIKDHYKIDNDPKNLMKASTILQAVIYELQFINKDKLKLGKELSNILLKMGLKKKRMADGIYYYGIVPKPNIFLSSDENTEEMFKKTVEEHKLEPVSNILKSLKTNGSRLQSTSIEL